jgi:hypothetical protein
VALEQVKFEDRCASWTVHSATGHSVYVSWGPQNQRYRLTRTTRDCRLPPRYKWDLRSSGGFTRRRLVVTDVSGQTGPSSRVQQSKKIYLPGLLGWWWVPHCPAGLAVWRSAATWLCAELLEARAVCCTYWKHKCSATPSMHVCVTYNRRFVRNGAARLTGSDTGSVRRGGGCRFSAVSIVTRLRAGRSRVRMLVGGDFVISKHVQTCLGAQPGPHWMGTGAPSRW